MGYRQLAAYQARATNGMSTPFQLNGTPTSGAGGSFAGRAVVGSLLLDYATGKLYACTASAGGSVIWQLTLQPGGRSSGQARPTAPGGHRR
jgi:hypothetical protein